MRSFGIRFGLLAVVVSVMIQSAPAASINYGNFSLPSAGVSFLDVTESSGTDPVPLFGPPLPYLVGMDFNPLSFTSTSNLGAADITDGQLNFTISSVVTPTGGVGINSVNLSEAGDYTLAGTGTAATQAFAGVILRATVKEIDGLPVSPINLLPVNASVGFNLPANPGIANPWSLGVFLNIEAQLAGMGLTPTYGATKIDIVLNNTLVTTSEPSSVSFIAKKDFRIGGDTELTGTIPEPASFSILAITGMLMFRRSRAA